MEKNIDLSPLKPGSKVIVAVSGGPDSMYLLHELLKLKFELVVAHLNHGLRGKESDAEENFVKKFAEKKGLKYEGKKLKKRAKGNLEEVLREARYDFLEKIRKKHKADMILTAHHLNDNIETVLFNFIRGSSVEGLSGMTIFDEKRKLLRPLLFVRKEQILTSIKRERIPYRLDSSNEDIAFSRNLLRHRVIPLLKKINPNLEQTLSENTAYFKLLKHHLQNEAAAWLAGNRKNQKIDQNAFLELPEFLQKNIVGKLYRETIGSSKKMNQRYMNEILKMLVQKKSNREKEFGQGHVIRISKEQNKRMIEIKKKAHK